jgi:hypothetical protein
MLHPDDFLDIYEAPDAETAALAAPSGLGGGSS